MEEQVEDLQNETYWKIDTLSEGFLRALTFLNGTLDDKIYMEQPEGYIYKQERNTSCVS